MTDRTLIAGQLKPRNRRPSDEEIDLFVATCERTGLDPLARQIYAQYRTDSRTQQEVMAIQATIDGFRVVAERSGVYLGGDQPQWCGADGLWQDVWLDESKPHAARVTVHKAVAGMVGDTTVVAHWKEYAPTGAAAQMWTKMPALMLAKVAEALALRRAFPMVLSGIYSAEEMAQATPERAVPENVGEPDSNPPDAPPTDPEAVAALKAACKNAQLNWGKIKECYTAAGLDAPEAFSVAFTHLDDDQALKLLAAIKDRQIAESTDAPYPAAEIEPSPPGTPEEHIDGPDLPWSGDSESAPGSAAATDAATEAPQEVREGSVASAHAEAPAGGVLADPSDATPAEHPLPNDAEVDEEEAKIAEEIAAEFRGEVEETPAEPPKRKPRGGAPRRTK